MLNEIPEIKIEEKIRLKLVKPILRIPELS
jgi:hypothetical protein